MEQLLLFCSEQCASEPAVMVCRSFAGHHHRYSIDRSLPPAGPARPRCSGGVLSPNLGAQRVSPDRLVHFAVLLGLRIHHLGHLARDADRHTQAACRQRGPPGAGF